MRKVISLADYIEQDLNKLTYIASLKTEDPRVTYTLVYDKKYSVYYILTNVGKKLTHSYEPIDNKLKNIPKLMHSFNNTINIKFNGICIHNNGIYVCIERLDNMELKVYSYDIQYIQQYIPLVTDDIPREDIQKYLRNMTLYNARDINTRIRSLEKWMNLIRSRLAEASNKIKDSHSSLIGDDWYRVQEVNKLYEDMNNMISDIRFMDGRIDSFMRNMGSNIEIVANETGLIK